MNGSAAPRPYELSDGGDLLPLIDDLLGQGHRVRLRVTGGSMAPWIEGGSVVTLRRVASSELTVGGMVFFRTAAGRPLLHRIIRRERVEDGSVRLLIKGDACLTTDGYIPESFVIGKVVALSQVTRGGIVRDVSQESRFRPGVHRLLAFASHRSPRLFASLSHRVIRPWRRWLVSFAP